MPLLRDSAVVLGRLDYSETSQILVLMTREHGKVRAIAKGARRSTRTRFAPGIDLLDIGTAVFSVRHERAEGLATLTEWSQTQSFYGLRQRLERLSAAQYLAEVTARLTEDWDPHPELFDELIGRLRQIAESTDPLVQVVRFQFALLEQIGSLPRFDGCVVCGRDTELTHFSSFEGGLVCRNCEPGRVEKWEISPATATFLQNLDIDAAHTDRESPDPCVAYPHSDPPASATHDSKRIFAVLNYHISHLMGAEPRLAESLVPAKLRRQV